jgi:hypothetical protein
MRPVTSSTPVELLSARDRNLLLGCDSLPLGQAWPAEGVYVKRSTSFFGPDLTCAAQACGRPNGGELCLRISRLTGDSISDLIQWAQFNDPGLNKWKKLWKVVQALHGWSRLQPRSLADWRRLWGCG